MKNSFQGILHGNEINEPTLVEKHKFLIDRKIYLLGSPKVDIFNKYEIDSFHLDARGSSAPFMGRAITYNDKCYNINEILIEEVFDNLKKHFHDTFLRNIHAEKVFKNQIFYYSKEMMIKEETDLINKKILDLNNKIYSDLNESLDILDFEGHCSIFRSFIEFDAKIIIDYLHGLDNLQNSGLIHIYSNYLRTSIFLKCISENKFIEVPEVKNTLPKKIALLHDLGLYETDKFKSLLETNKYKILAYLFDIDFDNKNRLDVIRRNYASLSHKSNENTDKFTASKNTGKIIKSILGNQN